MIATAVPPIASPISARRSIGSGRARCTGEAGFSSRTPKVQAESMNSPSRAASIAYSGRWSTIRRICSTLCADPGLDTEDLGHAPGLGGCTHGAKGRLGLEALRELAQTSLLEPGEQAAESGPGAGPRRRTISPHGEEGIDVRAEKPGPDQALVVCGVALRRAASVHGPIPGIAGGQGPQSDRGQQR